MEKNTVKLLHYHTYAMRMRSYFKKYPEFRQFSPPNIPYPYNFLPKYPVSW